MLIGKLLEKKAAQLTEDLHKSAAIHDQNEDIWQACTDNDITAFRNWKSSGFLINLMAAD